MYRSNKSDTLKYVNCKFFMEAYLTVNNTYFQNNPKLFMLISNTRYFDKVLIDDPLGEIGSVCFHYDRDS